MVSQRNILSLENSVDKSEVYMIVEPIDLIKFIHTLLRTVPNKFKGISLNWDSLWKNVVTNS